MKLTAADFTGDGGQQKYSKSKKRSAWSETTVLLLWLLSIIAFIVTFVVFCAFMSNWLWFEEGGPTLFRPTQGSIKYGGKSRRNDQPMGDEVYEKIPPGPMTAKVQMEYQKFSKNSPAAFANDQDALSSSCCSSSSSSLRGAGGKNSGDIKSERSKLLLDPAFAQWHAGHSLMNPDYHPPNDYFAGSHSSLPFDRPAPCPEFPTSDYPKEYPIMSLVRNWNPDDSVIPPRHYDSLCHFDFATEQHKAYNYRDADVPFVVYNVSDLDMTAARWSNPDYLVKLLGARVSYRSEVNAQNNHFMYWRPATSSYKRTHKKEMKNWKEPTGEQMLTYSRWLEYAIKGQESPLNSTEYKYFRASSSADSWQPHELRIFKRRKSLFVIKPGAQHGIHCRFGMRSVIAEAHWDGSNNFVAQLGGLRRWILSNPTNCENMYIFKKGHPSGRHSSVDWSSPDLTKYPLFEGVRANEFIAQPGDVLFVPTNWVHHITSLNINYQCNARSGVTHRNARVVDKCYLEAERGTAGG
jgi:hypothetical protein